MLAVVAKRIESYLSTAETAKTPVSREVNIARHILQSCKTLFTELEVIKIGEQKSTSILDLCDLDWSAAENSIGSVLVALESHAVLGQEESRQLAIKCRQVVGALYTCVGSLTSMRTGELEMVSDRALELATRVLQEIVADVRQLQAKVQDAVNHSTTLSSTSTTKRLHQQTPDAADSISNTAQEKEHAIQGSGTESTETRNEHTKSGSESAGDSPLYPTPSVHTTTMPEPAPERAPETQNKTQSKRKSRTKHRATETQADAAVREAIAAALALVELLRIFTRVSQQSWVNTRSQLAHAPSVPSPLSSGGTTLRHRRWVSEEIESEPALSASGLQISVDGKPMDVDSAVSSSGESPSHMRNRSDSRVRLGDAPNSAPALRKSALSLRGKTSVQQQQQQSGGLVSGDAGDRSKQVRFVSAPPLQEAQVDQGSLNELTQLLLQFEKAVSALQNVLLNADTKSDGATDGSHPAIASYAHEIRGVVTAFVRISKLSSSTGMVKHYDKPTLAQFKITTNAVKQLMALLPKSSSPS
ncbi:hypothetical protein GGH99_003993 [Coemansia sp. RSA 1285]|nr:hypothetical protein EV177_007814 [Coemansia sp. RSA 1804]KAJ2684634.1 hypothetical protein GGH99_003993 [Coemansia sp. RSA 1285]